MKLRTWLRAQAPKKAAHTSSIYRGASRSKRSKMAGRGHGHGLSRLAVVPNSLGDYLTAKSRSDRSRALACCCAHGCALLRLSLVRVGVQLIPARSTQHRIRDRSTAAPTGGNRERCTDPALFAVCQSTHSATARCCRNLLRHLIYYESSITLK